MCFPMLLSAVGLGGGAAAAGALSTLGTVVSIGGSLLSGIQGMQAAKAQSQAIAEQRATERQLNAVQDQRARSKFATQIAQQRAELAARGVQLDSPTAMALGQTAAQEMSFESQAIRSGGRARDAELSAAQRAARAQGASSLLRGVVSAAGTLMTAPPETWDAFRKGGA